MKKENLLLTTMLAMMSFAGTLKAQTAEIQIIHNAADPVAASVDVYVNGNLALDDFAFRTATPFITLPAGVALNVGVAPGNSTSVNDTLKNFEITLTAGNRYVAIANGVINPSSFAPNPDGANTAFNLYIKDNIQTTANNPSNVDFVVMHGSTDAPTVDVLARNVATLVDNASYSDITNYLSVPAADYTLDITPGNDNSNIIVSYTAPLSLLAGGSAVVVASGFLDPSVNQNGDAFGLWVYLADGTGFALQQTSTARLQIIHNAADPAAATVDVYVEGALLLDDFAFRAATPYLDVPAGVTLNIGIAPGNSTSANDTLVNIPVTLVNGQTYIAVASGVLSPGSFAVNPDGENTGFTLLLQDNMRESAVNPLDVDLRVIHGSTDAPTVDVIARNIATLVNDAKYKDITGYISVPANNYILDITPGNNNTSIVASFDAPLSSLSGGAAVVLASGFLNPSANQNGEAFGLIAVLPDGTVLPLNSIQQARLQVIHNAADPAAVAVDVYVNGTLLLDDFAFRMATPYIDVPAGVVLNIGIAPSNSSSANDTLVNIPVSLQNGQTYVAIANGVLTPGNFATNPDGLNTGFSLWLQDNMRESALNASDVDLRVVHGCTDAPTVDVIAAGVATLVDNAAYGDITNYISVPANDYTLNITPGNNNSVIVASFLAPASGLAGGAAVVLASGFLNPAANQNGAAFGLLAVLPDGTALLLPNVTGINEVGAISGMYPNPANDVVTLKLNEGFQNSVIRLTELSGKLIKEIKSNELQNTINVSTLSKGMYLVTVSNEKGSYVSKLSIN